MGHQMQLKTRIFPPKLVARLESAQSSRSECERFWTGSLATFISRTTLDCCDWWTFIYSSDDVMTQLVTLRHNIFNGGRRSPLSGTSVKPQRVHSSVNNK